MKTNSYKKIIQSHVMGLGVCKEEQMSYYREVHRLMAMGGIIDPQTLMADRKKPFKNSPWGEFKNYEYRDGKRVHVDSYILNEQGVARVNEILTKYVTDRYLTKGKLASADLFVKEMRGMIDGSLLVAWLANKGVEVKEVKEVKKDAQPHSLVFTLNNRRHTYYHKENLVVWSESQGKNAPVEKSNPFWFIMNQKTHQLSSVQERAIAATSIFADHWNVKFGNGLALPDSKAPEG